LAIFPNLKKGQREPIEYSSSYFRIKRGIASKQNGGEVTFICMRQVKKGTDRPLIS
jgi:hypothetical protein